MALRCFRKEIVLAGFSAETQAPTVVVDETKLSPTVCTAILQLGHETLHLLRLMAPRARHWLPFVPGWFTPLRTRRVRTARLVAPSLDLSLGKFLGISARRLARHKLLRKLRGRALTECGFASRAEPVRIAGEAIAPSLCRDGDNARMFSAAPAEPFH